MTQKNEWITLHEITVSMLEALVMDLSGEAKEHARDLSWVVSRCKTLTSRQREEIEPRVAEIQELLRVNRREAALSAIALRRDLRDLAGLG